MRPPYSVARPEILSPCNLHTTQKPVPRRPSFALATCAKGEEGGGEERAPYPAPRRIDKSRGEIPLSGARARAIADNPTSEREIGDGDRLLHRVQRLVCVVGQFEMEKMLRSGTAISVRPNDDCASVWVAIQVETRYPEITVSNRVKGV